MAGTEIPLRLPVPADRPLQLRVAMLERLVLELTKHVVPAEPLSPSMALTIEELKLRNPDV